MQHLASIGASFRHHLCSSMKVFYSIKCFTGSQCSLSRISEEIESNEVQLNPSLWTRESASTWDGTSCEFESGLTVPDTYFMFIEPTITQVPVLWVHMAWYKNCAKKTSDVDWRNPSIDFRVTRHAIQTKTIENFISGFKGSIWAHSSSTTGNIYSTETCTCGHAVGKISVNCVPLQLACRCSGTLAHDQRPCCSTPFPDHRHPAEGYIRLLISRIILVLWRVARTRDFLLGWSIYIAESASVRPWVQLQGVRPQVQMCVCVWVWGVCKHGCAGADACTFAGASVHPRMQLGVFAGTSVRPRVQQGRHLGGGGAGGICPPPWFLKCQCFDEIGVLDSRKIRK